MVVTVGYHVIVCRVRVRVSWRTADGDRQEVERHLCSDYPVPLTGGRCGCDLPSHVKHACHVCAAASAEKFVGGPGSCNLPKGSCKFPNIRDIDARGVFSLNFFFSTK